MSNVIFSSAQRVIRQTLDWLQTSSQTKTGNFITDSFQTGIIPLELGEFSVVPGSNNTSLTPTVTIGSGVAYGPDSNRIIVASGDVTPYNSSAPSTTTNDGLGNFLLTPQSTGVVNIPVTQSSQNYVWIQYLATIDTSAYTLNKETNAKQFYKQTDGYQITVTTTNVAPGANYLFLANVNMLGGGAVTSSIIFITSRTYFQISETVVPITTAFNDRSNATTVYTENSTYNLEAHIKAIGTGTGQSPTNPHNTSLSDLGVSIFDTVIAHRQLEHGNAIIAGTVGNEYPSTSAMATSINIVSPGSDTINVFQLLSSEFAIINGTAYNVNAIFGAVPVNATVMFPDVSGTYNVYWDSVTKAFAVTTGSISADVTKLWLCTVTYTFVGHGVTDHNALSSLIEKRRIGSTVEKFQRWVTAARPTNPILGEYGYNLTLSYFEYWDGTAWRQPATLLNTLPLSNNRIIISSGNHITEQTALTPFKPIVTDASGLPVTSGSDTAVTSALLTGLTPSLGTITATDSILSAFGKVINARVVQIVQSTSTTAFTTSSGSYVATNLSASITPQSTSNKILIFAVGALGGNGSLTNFCTLFKNGVNMFGANGMTQDSAGGATSSSSSGVLCFLDSPATTSALTYAVYIKVSGASGFFGNGGEQVMILIEIGE